MGADLWARHRSLHPERFLETVTDGESESDIRRNLGDGPERNPEEKSEYKDWLRPRFEFVKLKQLIVIQQFNRGVSHIVVQFDCGISHVQQ